VPEVPRRVKLYSVLFFFLQSWGLNSGPSPWTTPLDLYMMGFFSKIGYCEPFGQAGLKPRSSWSLPPE
jgi:hypothetical protein